jgi:hypothetical protein
VRVCGFAAGGGFADIDGADGADDLAVGVVVGVALAAADVSGAGGLDVPGTTMGCAKGLAECVLNPSSSTNPATVATIAAQARFIMDRQER